MSISLDLSKPSIAAETALSRPVPSVYDMGNITSPSARFHENTPAAPLSGSIPIQTAAEAPVLLQPDGGYGWVCTACVAIINGHTWGLNSSYGVFLAHYLKENTYPSATPLHFAFVGSLSISCALLISPLAIMSTRHFGTKPTMYIGVVVEATSLVCASFAHKIWHLFLTQGFLFGVGMGFLFVPSCNVIPQWFTTNRSLANGISAAGSGMGGLLYSLVSGVVIRKHGVAWTYRMLGITAFAVNAFCTTLVKDRHAAIGSRQNAFDTKLFRRLEYFLLLAYGWFSLLGYIVLIFSLANYANSIGLGASDAALISAMFNLGQGIGRPFIGYFSDRSGRINMAAFMTLICAIFVFAIWIPAKSLSVLILFAILGGAVAGTFWTTIAPVTAEVVGLADIPSALNLMWLVLVLPSTFSEAMALEIVAGTGKYIGAQAFVGCMYVIATGSLVVLRGWKIRENMRTSAASTSSSESSETAVELAPELAMEKVPQNEVGLVANVGILRYAFAMTKV
ncbi:putative transporter MCH2 [Ceratocystis fimbriata CBS 114723]|uniref:Putative transporter MCH2 n=1 Tax=Ceratocystis fimbriata CBS 114723 TaxID=1035309 RepID=A0A2C5X3B8_9PEZI|nr:putative transporter MCH2 [Ceratocystis fimbriata CBS 114723]